MLTSSAPYSKEGGVAKISLLLVGSSLGKRLKQSLVSERCFACPSFTQVLILFILSHITGPRRELQSLGEAVPCPGSATGLPSEGAYIQ